MDSLVMQGYKSGLKIVPTIPRYDNSGNEINDASYWPVPIDEAFRTNYGFNIYTGNGELVATTNTTKRFIVTDYGGFTPKNPKESYSAQELYNLVLDARGLTNGKNYALSVLDNTTGKAGRVILTASNTAARLTYALTLQLVDSEGNALSNKAIPVNKCAWHILPDGVNGGIFPLEPRIVTPGLTLEDPSNLPTQVYLRYGLYVAPFMGRLDGGVSGDVAIGTVALPEGSWGTNSSKTAEIAVSDTALDFPFWCFAGSADALKELGIGRYRATVASVWTCEITLHRHSSITNNIDQITITSDEPWYIGLQGNTDPAECNRDNGSVEP